MNRERRTIQSPKSNGDSTEKVMRYLPYVPPPTTRGCLPSPPLRLSQDCNIFSMYFTDGAGRLRYIPDAREDKYLASIAGLLLRCGAIASGRMQLRRGGELEGNDMSHRDHTQVPPSPRLDIFPAIRQHAITLVHQILACTVDMRSHVKQAGWNVKGQDFAACRPSSPPLHSKSMQRRRKP
jgi:hypothetical protein